MKILFKNHEAELVKKMLIAVEEDVSDVDLIITNKNIQAKSKIELETELKEKFKEPKDPNGNEVDVPKQPK